MKRYQITVDGRTFDVSVLDDPRAKIVRVEVDGDTLTVRAEALPLAEEPHPAGEPHSESPPSIPAVAIEGPEPPASLITAPLPGVIKSIAARLGERVTAGDPLLVIEAMKMDNVIRAPRKGTIAAIHVAEGGRVAHGDPLVAFAD
jgi:biotin carboxyl carrier protein